MKIVIAGASGFVGKRLLESLSATHDIIALRRAAHTPGTPTLLPASQTTIEWRKCDLFSLLQAEEALVGADVAIYLVHSMLPTARLSQGTFEDADLLIADNFARAAEKNGVRRIIYLGGLIPSATRLSRHLNSRLEVEHALSSRSVKLTTLRAGLIIGPNGSSFQILYLLVKRLPVLLCPKWVWTLTQAIALDDVIQLFKFVIAEEKTSGETYDIGGPDVVTYRDLMQAVADQLHVKRLFLNVPIFTPGLSRLWVRLITGASNNLIAPLIESLRHQMTVENPRLLQLYGKPLTRLADAIKTSVEQSKDLSLRATTKKRTTTASAKRDVRSIQRLVLPPRRNAQWIALEYFRWLPDFLAPLIIVTESAPEIWDFRLVGIKKPMLTLSHSSSRSSPERQIFFITGGMLVKINPSVRGRLEFRQVIRDEFILAAIHDFNPRLPWLIYKYSQALVHLWVMHNFGKHLRRAKADQAERTGKSDV